MSMLVRYSAVVYNSCRGLACLDARCPPKLLCHSSSSTGQGRKNTRGSWVEIKDRERSFTNYRHRQNRLNLGKLVYFVPSQGSSIFTPHRY